MEMIKARVNPRYFTRMDEQTKVAHKETAERVFKYFSDSKLWEYKDNDTAGLEEVGNRVYRITNILEYFKDIFEFLSDTTEAYASWQRERLDTLVG